MNTEMEWKNYEQSADLLKALAHPVRLCIVHRLAMGACSNVSCLEQSLGISQSSVSQHLAKLRSAGIVTGRRCGNETCYELSNEQAGRPVRYFFE